MKSVLANMEEHEGGYAVRHRNQPVSEFGCGKGKYGTLLLNPIAAAYPTLFPYGVGGFEVPRKQTISFDEEVHCALQYHNGRFRTHHSFAFVVFSIEQKRQALRSAWLQMTQNHFERDVLALNSLTVADFIQAEKEEEAHVWITNSCMNTLQKHVFTSIGRMKGSDNMQALYWGQIWGTCLHLRGPSLWMTINPTDIHDPIVQILAGEEIDMDNFDANVGPDASKWAFNVAHNPYAATQFFFFIINVVLNTLFAINTTQDRVRSGLGLLGKVSAVRTTCALLAQRLQKHTYFSPCSTLPIFVRLLQSHILPSSDLACAIRHPFNLVCATGPRVPLYATFRPRCWVCARTLLHLSLYPQALCSIVFFASVTIHLGQSRPHHHALHFSLYTTALTRHRCSRLS